MLRFKGFSICLAFVFLCFLDSTASTGGVLDPEWQAYKLLYGKDYVNTATTEAYARYYYSYNKNLIENHNAYYDKGLRTFRLRINQFSDMRLITFNALFPETTPLNGSFSSPLPTVGNPTVNDFDPIADLGFIPTIEDQGTVCNSGWAYATAKSVELLQAFQSSDMNPASLSAQNLIDCAGRSRGCTNQVPQTGFEYLTKHHQKLHLSSEYLNDNKEKEPGMCLLPNTSTRTAALSAYASLIDGDDTNLRRMIHAQYPVVIEFNPTSFEFMHYSEGIFQQPAINRGSHFMTVIGYGVSGTLKYFILQNSFGTTWGEGGLIRIAYSSAKPLTKSAILPTR